MATIADFYRGNRSFGEGAPPIVTVGTSSGGGEGQDRANINYLLNPYYDTSEARMNAAAQNLGQGVAGSGFASGTTNRLLESEKVQRFQLGHQMLEPYLQRSFQAQQSAADRAARLNEIAAQGAQALQQLQLSEAGQTARLTQAERAELEQQILKGQQAMQQAQLAQAGETSRTRLGIGGNILNTLLRGYGEGESGGGTRTSAGRGVNDISTGATTPGYISSFDWASQTPSFRTAPPQPAGSGGRTGGVNMSTIDSILRRYGLQF